MSFIFKIKILGFEQSWFCIVFFFCVEHLIVVNVFQFSKA